MHPLRSRQLFFAAADASGLLVSCAGAVLMLLAARAPVGAQDAQAIPRAASVTAPSVAAPGGTPSATATPPADVTPRSRVGRVALEVVFGALGLVGGGALGATLGGDACAPTPDGDGTCWTGFWWGAVIGTAVGAPTGVLLAGLVLDGNGSVGWTALGSLAGEVAWLALAKLASAAGAKLGVAVFGGALLPIVGSVVAYELSSDDRASAHRGTRRVVSLRASFAPTRDGAALAISGTF